MNSSPTYIAAVKDDRKFGIIRSCLVGKNAGAKIIRFHNGYDLIDFIMTAAFLNCLEYVAPRILLSDDINDIEPSEVVKQLEKNLSLNNIELNVKMITSEYFEQGDADIFEKHTL